MNREEFDALVSRLEIKAGKNPQRFKWHVAAWAILGFGYILLVLTTALSLTLGLLFMMIRFPSALTVKLGIVFGILTGGLSWAILRGLFVRLTVPDGVRLTRQVSPELFRCIDELRASLNTSGFDRVLLTPEHNAGVVQTPRLGVFGWHHNTLLLGLPLMQGVSVDEFRAILAHELAHLSGADGKFGAWIYRMRQTWERIFDQLTRQKQGSRVLGKFIEWFWPKFNARAFVLSRSQEYAADATAVRLTSAEAVAHGLIRTQVQSRWLDEKFWPDFFDRARDSASPPTTLFREIGSGIGSLHDHPESPRWLSQAYNFRTSNADTHPSLKDRLLALPNAPENSTATIAPETLPASSNPDSATALLGDQLPMLVERLTKEWSQHVAPMWKERHTAVRGMTEELTKLETTQDVTVDGLWQRTQIIIDRDGDAQAQPLIDQILNLDPNHSPANFVRGRFLLSQEDEAGIVHIERAIQHDGMLTSPACNLLYAYYSRTGQQDKLRPLEHRVDRHDEKVAFAQVERNNASPKDTFLPADLTDKEAADLRETLAKHSGIAVAHIVRKQVVHFPETPMYLICLTIRYPWWSFRLSSSNAKLIETVVNTVTLRGNWLTFADEGNFRSLAKAIRKIPGSEVYRKSS